MRFWVWKFDFIFVDGHTNLVLQSDTTVTELIIGTAQHSYHTSFLYVQLGTDQQTYSSYET